MNSTHKCTYIPITRLSTFFNSQHSILLKLEKHEHISHMTTYPKHNSDCTNTQRREGPLIQHTLVELHCVYNATFCGANEDYDNSSSSSDMRR